MASSTVSGNIFDKSVVSRIFDIIRPYKKVFYFNAFLVVLLAVLSPVRPFLIQYTVDKFVVVGNIEGVKHFTFIMIGLLALESVLRYFFTYYSSWLAQSAVKDLRFQVFEHLTKLKLQFFDKTPIGMLTTRTVSDIEAISQVFSDGLLTIIGDILQLVVILVLMLVTDWKLTLISLATMPLLVYSSYVFKESVKKSFQDVRKEVAHLNTFLQERITGMNIIQIFNREKIEHQAFKTINGDLNQAHLRGVFAYSVFFPLVEIITAASLGLLVWWGVKDVLQYNGSIGTIISFILYVNMFFRPIRMLADKFNSLQMGMVASERVFKLLDNNETANDTGTTNIEQVKGNIEFKNVSFEYIENQTILNNISFSVEEGKTLAIVGATGSGKTTIINVLSRFYELKSGEIYLDGIDIRQIPLTQLHQHIGIVLQDVFLFSGTILENITLKNPDIALEEIERIAQFTGINRFIDKLPNRYHYNVMERGYALSAGQRQLIAFLRAMVYNPKILVLDEATSSIDTETEQILQQATDTLTANRTSIVIAHRLSTIQNADQILVMEKGEIVEQGTHQELLAMQGNYHKLYQMQFKMVNTLETTET